MTTGVPHNIGPKGRRVRMATGVIGAFVYFAGLAGMIAAGHPREARAFLFAPAFFSALGILQARAGT